KMNGTLRADPRGYLRIALAAVPYISGMTDSRAILELTRDVSYFDQAATRMETESEPAVRVAELLRTKLREIELRYGMESYFRDIYALRAMPLWAHETGEVVGWKCDLGGDPACFEHSEIWTWPSVLLTSIVRSAATARLTVDGDEVDGEIAWVEHISLTLGFQHGCVIPYLRFDSHIGIWPTGQAKWRYRDAPWFCPGFPPPAGRGTGHVLNRHSGVHDGRKALRTVSFEIVNNQTVKIPEELAKNDSRRYWASTLPPSIYRAPVAVPGSDGKIIQRMRIERIDAGTLTEWLTEYRIMPIESQFLPYKIDPAEILCPPNMLNTVLALIEGVLL
ncbi:hypothetical protein, partial [Azospirillum sp. B506]|uniref:hypothetical protein n=1 Tax=Azospirillum sp. B506 TaxID=137721 RepID=UPI0005B2AFFF